MNRFLTLSLRLDGKIGYYEDDSMKGKRDEYQSQYIWYMQTYDMKNALDKSFEFATELNRYIDEMKPWKLDPANPSEHTSLMKTLSTVGMGLAFLGYNLAPFFETKMIELLGRIGVGHGWEMKHGFTIREK
mgnify:FL=1